MSANVTILLVATGLAVAAGSAVLVCARAMRRELAALRRDVAALNVPAPRAAAVDAAGIRAAVAGALADERERELAEARAFWAEQEAREAAGDGGPYAPEGVLPGEGYELPAGPPVLPYLPRQADFAGLEPAAEAVAEVPAEGAGGVPGTGTGGASGAGGVTGASGPEADAPEATLPTPGAIPHPSGPDFTPYPVVASRDQTADRLAELADARIPLSDVRPGPLGTLDVYVFADGTTLCMTPGHRETALRLSHALDRGEVPVLRGGSAIAGAYALTFAVGDESVYVLADRVVASL